MNLPYLYTNGKAFVEDGGARRWVYSGSSDFKLWQRFMAGQDIGPVLQQRKDCGANVLRVFTMFDGALGRFHPWEGDWPTSVRTFIPYVATYGLRIKWDVFADAQYAMANWLRPYWWHDFTTTCADYANVCLISLGNEWPQNGFRPTDFTRPTNTGRLLFSRGSSLSDCPPWGHYGDPYIEPWDFLEWHGRRDDPKYRLDSDQWYIGDGWEPPRVGRLHPARPIIHDEPIGFAEAALPGRRANDTESAQAVALGARKDGCGGTFHSDQGIDSVLWTGKTLASAQAFYRALNAYIGEDY